MRSAFFNFDFPGSVGWLGDFEIWKYPSVGEFGITIWLPVGGCGSPGKLCCAGQEQEGEEGKEGFHGGEEVKIGYRDYFL